MIQIVESPKELLIKSPIELFLAGGITNVRDWQSDLIERLLIDSENKIHDYLSNVVVYNPRRQYFHNEVDEIIKQINREHCKLKKSDIISYWFAKGSLNPIVLLEYGKFGLSSNKPIVVGIDEGYERKMDIEIQTKLSRPEININYNFKDFYYNVLAEIKKLCK